MAHITVIDDEPEIRKLLCLMLEGEHQVSDFSNCEDAIKSSQNQSPDLLITDIIFPGLENESGIDAIIEFKHDFPKVKTIAISGGGGFTSDPMMFLECAEKYGADITLCKPFTGRELIDAVDQLLPASGM